MADVKQKIISSSKKRMQFLNALLNDIAALEYMIEQDMFDKNIHIGAEQELCIVQDEWRPADNNLALLKEINHSSFTTELAKYNIEINLDPCEVKAGCFKKMHKQLSDKLKLANKAAATLNSKLILAGILPTLTRNEINLDYLTPLLRYEYLSKKLKKIRGGNFDLYLKGVDELHIRHDSIMFEACNTSFQTHLQIHPKEFVQAYNWALIISAPVLAAASNSPLLMGKELWSEIRIALFQQSIETRHHIHETRDQHPRVTFGNNFIYDNVTEIYKEDISRYEILITTDDIEDSLEMVKQGNIPKLNALRLHNGTIYRWNRPCYGVNDNKAHMRIENRYIPAGPSVQDEMANMAFWTGLMLAIPRDAIEAWNHYEFRDVKSNFFKAARSGIESIVIWKEKEISVKELILHDLIPLAYAGLKKSNLSDEEIYIYLGTIEKRMHTHTGAQWQIKNYRSLRYHISQTDSVISLTQAMYENQQKNIPVCDWKNINVKKYVEDRHKKIKYVKQLMTTDLITAFPDDSLEFVSHIMEWHNIDHMMVEDRKGKLSGIITIGHIHELKQQDIDLKEIPIKRIMRKDIQTIHPEEEIEKALEIMKSLWISSLPVIDNDHLIGIVTK
ncbi:MAG: CBS domain-containing protein, partial [Chitinophagales bacterium]|nr:CBS domain-containing protein [Chitinophagales bacterium]